jgi:hypothetical protein
MSPRPAPRTTARFHADRTFGAIGEKLQKLRALDLLAHDLSGLFIRVTHLKNVLCKADPDWPRLHDAPPPVCP